MRRVVYSVAASLDGYVAGPNGEYDWIVMDPEIDFGAIMNRFDTILMGRRTYEATVKMGGGGEMPGTRAFVVSRSMQPADFPKLNILGDNAEQAIGQMKAEQGKDIWLFGGGDLFRSLLQARLVDIVEVAIVPVLLGGGVPLLPSPADRAKLKLTKQCVYKTTGTVGLEYEVVP